MAWAARSAGVLLGLGSLACGVEGDAARSSLAPAPVSLAGSCTVEGLRLEVEDGVLGGSGDESPCSYSGRFVSIWRGLYEQRWGAIPLQSWTVRVRAPDLVDANGHAALTWYDRRLIEVSQIHFELLPHELHHARQGEGSNDHHGWCADFVPWELERQIQDERARLGCVQ